MAAQHAVEHAVHVAQVVYSRRELHQISNVAGMLSNAVLSKALKRIFQQSRPSHTCSALSICQSAGMPSSHAQMIWFVWTLHMIMPFRDQQRPPHSESTGCATVTGEGWQLLHLAEGTVLLLLSIAVAFARVYLGYHTMWQVRCTSSGEQSRRVVPT